MGRSIPIVSAASFPFVPFLPIAVAIAPPRLSLLGCWLCQPVLPPPDRQSHCSHPSIVDVIWQFQPEMKSKTFKGSDSRMMGDEMIWWGMDV